MESTSIILLVMLYMLVIQGIIDMMPLLPYALRAFSSQIPLLISIMGVILGLGFYGLSLLHTSIKFCIKIGITMLILGYVSISSYIGGKAGFFEAFELLLMIFFTLLICGIPLGGTYGILKKNKSAAVSAGIGIIIIFFLRKTVLSGFNPSSYSIDFIVMFFILLILFMELGTSSAFYNSVLNRMAPKDSIDETNLIRLSRVINHYLVYLLLIIVSCSGVTLGILYFNDYILSVGPKEIMNIDMSSFNGILLSVILVMIGIYILWVLIPREKDKKPKKLNQ
jgi:hypothetical protein